MNKIISSIILTGSIFTITPATFACSEFNHDFGRDLGIYTSRTMDLFIDLKPSLAIYPRGTNEKGLTAHLLYLGDTIQPKRDTSKPGVNGLY